MLGVSLNEVTPATYAASGGRGLNAQPMQIVFVLEVSVEAWLSDEGRVGVPRPESCPTCGHDWLTFDGWYPRQTRRGRVFIQRVLCARDKQGCEQSSHSLMPDVLVSGRVDLVRVIGWALEAKMGGWGHRRIGEQLGVPASTVRGWLRRVGVCGYGVATVLLGVAAMADPAVRAPPVTGPVACLVVAAHTAARAFGGLSQQPVDAWRFAVRHCGGRLLG